MSEKAALVSLGVVGSYFGLYSAYDKKEKTLIFKKVTDILSFKDKKQSVSQINKVVALSSLTIAGTALVPNPLSEGCERPLLKIATGMGLVHTVTSLAIFYGFDPRIMLRGEGKSVKGEQLALVSGILGLWLFCEEAIKSEDVADTRARASYAAAFLALLHFYFIETPTGLPQDLPVRPYGYLAFVASIAAVAYQGPADIAKVLMGRVCRLLGTLGVAGHCH